MMSKHVINNTVVNIITTICNKNLSEKNTIIKDIIFK